MKENTIVTTRQNKMRMVICAATYKILEYFEEKKTLARVRFYKSLEKYNTVEVDCDGDIILHSN